MVVWHNTPDAARIPEIVEAGMHASIWIGSFPIEPDQAVWVHLNIRNSEGNITSKTQNADWHSNDEGRHNSYWIARIGVFEAGDRVEYTIHGKVRDQEVADQDSFAFDVS